MIQTAAIVYAVIIAIVIMFQCCLIAGAPWGQLTQGGKYNGKLPTSGRLAAFISILLLLFMAGGIMSVAQLPPGWPSWVGWVVLVIQLLSTVLNLITPAKLERRLWGPVTIVLLGLACYVVFSQLGSLAT